jgi:hypothetical protein
MKTIARTLAILVAALAVAGLTYAVVQLSGAQQQATYGADAPAAQRPAGEGQAGGRPAGLPGEARRGGGLFAVAEVLKSFVIVAVITAIVAPVAHLLRRRGAALKEVSASEP